MLFLPGASGDGEFWRPVGEQLPATWEKHYFSWPGLGDQPHDPSVRGFEHLDVRVTGALARAGDLVAHSMGAIVAIRVAAGHPEKVRRLVLCAASGGVDVSRFAGADWRTDYRREFPDAAGWISEPQPDQARELELITASTLLLWGDRDPLSPVSVGEHLASILPNAVLEVIPGGTHGFARDDCGLVARLIASHLAS